MVCEYRSDSEATEAEPGHVEPDDYDAVDNDYHWEGAVGPSGVAGRDAGFPYDFSTSTAATDPTAGKFKVNNATLSAATELYISETDGEGHDLSAFMDDMDSGTSTVKGKVVLMDPATPANFAVFDISGTRSDNVGDGVELVSDIAKILSEGFCPHGLLRKGIVQPLQNELSSQ